MLRFIRNMFVELFDRVSRCLQTTNGTNRLPTTPNIRTAAQTDEAIILNECGNSIVDDEF